MSECEYVTQHLIQVPTQTVAGLSLFLVTFFTWPFLPPTPSSSSLCYFQRAATSVFYTLLTFFYRFRNPTATLPLLYDNSHAKFVRYLLVGIHDRRSSLFSVFYRSHTPVHVYTYPPAPMRPPQQIPHERPSFHQKHNNKHPLVEPFSTSQNAPSRVWPPVPAFSRQEARLPPSALTSSPMAGSSPRGQAPTPVSRSRMSTRSVGSTHNLRMDSGLASPELQMRPSHVRRQDSGRSVFTSSQSGSEDSVRFYSIQ